VTRTNPDELTAKDVVALPRDDIRKLSEAQQAGFQRLSRQLVELDELWHMKWSVHDLAIRDHGKRIADHTKRTTKLERRGAK
jgi:hypothetical protein